MRRIYILCLLGLFFFSGIQLYAYDFQSGGLYYNILDGNNVEVTSGDAKYEGEIIIPEKVTYDGKNYNVTSIGRFAFSGCSGLTSITIPSSVTSLGSYAFGNCSGLTSITIPNSVTSIDSYTLSGCSGLTSIKVESGNVVYDSRNNCNAIIRKSNNELIAGCKNTVIPNSVTSIGISAFEECSGLTSITIPSSVTSIGSYAFLWCSGLTSITIPSSVTSLGSYAFWNCSGLKDIISEIKTPFEINENVFSDYSKPTLTVPSGTKSAYQSTAGWNKFTNIVEAEGDNTSTKRTVHVATAGTLPDLISESEKYTIEELTLTGELNGTDFRLLRDMAGCNYLGEETVGKLTVLDFSDAKIVAGGEKYVDTNSLPYWYNTAKNTVDQNDILPHHVFHGCKLISVKISNRVTSIGDYAFSYCSGLTSITIPSSVTSIGDNAFSWCTGLTSITIPSSVTSIGNHSFEDCYGLTSITIPNSVTSIGDGAFHACFGLTSITIPSSVTSIGNNAFEYCTGLTSITIPSSVTSIGDYAFEDCYGLTSIVSEIVKPFAISENVFSNYSKPTLTVPSGTKSAYQSTEGWKNFTNIVEVEGNYTSTKRTIHVATAGTLPDLISESEKYTIEELTLTGELNGTDFRLLRDMAGCNYLGEETQGKLKVLDMSKAKVVKGGDKYFDTYIINENDILPPYIFYRCKFSIVILPNSVTSIGEGAFSWCIGLTSITIPNSVTNIGNNAFYYSGLTSITIPRTIKSIGNYAFWACNALISIVSEIVEPFEISEDVFSNYSRPVLTVPNGTLSAYQSTRYWFFFGNIVEENRNTRRTIHVATAGSLPSLISESEKYTIEELTLTGELNGTDFRLLRDMAGNNYLGQKTDGMLKVLDLSDAKVVAGGEKYLDTNNILGNGIDASYDFHYNISQNDEIPQAVFFGCYLRDIHFPNTVTSIRESAFEYCRDLSSITIPNSVTNIEVNAFRGCNALTAIKIPNSVKSIGNTTFIYCTNLTSIIVEGGNTKYDSRNDCNAIIETGTNTLILGCQKTTIPNSVTSIGFAAFVGCTGLTSITIPNSVKRIEDQAFAGCSGLTLVRIPNSVTKIEEAAFMECDRLTYIISEIKEPFEINEYVFYYIDYSKTTLIVPDGTKSAYQSTKYWNLFTKIVEISNIKIPASKHTIHVAKAGSLPQLILETEKYFIEELTLTGELNGTDFRLIRDMIGHDITGNTGGKLKVLDFSGANIVKGGDDTYFIEQDNIIPESCFDSCYNLESVFISNTVTTIGKDAFRGCFKLKSITIPNFVKTIDYEAFAGCKGLISITIPNSVTSIGAHAFRDCTSLTSLTIPNSVTEIGMYAFYGCRGLISVTLSNSLKMISGKLFLCCSSLSSIIIPNSVTNISYDAFNQCSNLSSITIPNSVTSIGGNAFYKCGSLTSITIPNSVTRIEGDVFYGCNSLASITIPSSVTYIGSEAFEGTAWLNNQSDGLVYAGKVAYGYKGLMPINTSVKIDEGTLGIAGGAFKNCYGLTSVIIPNSVTTIGYDAFSGCSGLTEIITDIENPFIISYDVFSAETYNMATLTVPFGSKEEYLSTGCWNKFVNIKENAPSQVSFTEQGITYLGATSTLKAEVQSVNDDKVVIPATVSYDGSTYDVTSVADGVLSNRTFDYVSLPSTITSLESSTFSNSTLGALIWNADTSLPSNVISNMAMPTSANFLLYVNKKEFAPSNVSNVVVDNTASSITLADGMNTRFYCPKSFTAQTISYTHHYSMTTGGNGKGWETIALPFDVQRIEHKTKGVITPFASYQSGSDQRPFWLCELGSNGFKRTASIKANTPYIISMPNSSNYDDEYILAGDVTFSATNVTVAETASLTTSTSKDKTFIPAFAIKDKASSVYALNVSNELVSNSSSNAGSEFVSDLRSVYPFEAYMTTSSSSARSLSIVFDDGTTGVDEIPLREQKTGIVKVYNLTGMLLLSVPQSDFTEKWKSLPSGVYIVNGQKMIKSDDAQYNIVQ